MKTKSYMTFKIYSESDYQIALLKCQQLLKNGFIMEMHYNNLFLKRQDNDGEQIRRFSGPLWQIKYLLDAVKKHADLIRLSRIWEAKIYNFRNLIRTTSNKMWYMVEKYQECIRKAEAV